MKNGDGMKSGRSHKFWATGSEKSLIKYVARHISEPVVLILKE